MKRFRIGFLLLAVVSISYSQAPQAFNYQAVLRHSNGEVRANETVYIQIELIQSTISGPAVYFEEHHVQTNEFGLINLAIGTGTSPDDFSSIDWSSDQYFIRTSVNDIVMGTSPLLSVPYALYAASAENADAANYSIIDNVDDADADPSNEIQALSLSGTALTLSQGGGTVTLPSSGGGDNWGTQVVESNTTLAGEGTSGSPLGVQQSQLLPSWGNIQDKPSGFDDDTDDVNDADHDPTNEHQSLSINGDQLTLSDEGGTVTLPSSSSPWITNGSNVYYDAGNVGIGTTAPEFKLSLDNDGGILAEGVFGSGNTLDATGSGARLIWYPRKAAFRAGYAYSDEWDDANIGENSVGMGFSSRASGFSSTAIGWGATSIGAYSLAMGVGDTASGYASISIGNHTKTISSWSTAFGIYNDDTGESSASWVPNDPLFMIGNGTTHLDRNNAMLIRKDGRVYFPDVIDDQLVSFTNPLYINIEGQIGYIPSSRKFKSNISPMEEISWIYDLNPVNFTYKSDEAEKKQYGLIAEEVEEVNTSFVVYDNDGEVQSVSYNQLISPMIKALQDQQKLIEELQVRIEILEAR